MLFYILSTINLHLTSFFKAIDRHFSSLFPQGLNLFPGELDFSAMHCNMLCALSFAMLFWRALLSMSAASDRQQSETHTRKCMQPTCIYRCAVAHYIWIQRASKSCHMSVLQHRACEDASTCMRGLKGALSNCELSMHRNCSVCRLLTSTRSSKTVARLTRTPKA